MDHYSLNLKCSQIGLKLAINYLRDSQCTFKHLAVKKKNNSLNYVLLKYI